MTGVPWQGDIVFVTFVSFGTVETVNPVAEPKEAISQSVSGWGCRPTRPGIWNRLRMHFPYVYCTRTQPNHIEFPIDWLHADDHKEPLARSILVGSFEPLDLPSLTTDLLDNQTY